MILMALLLTSFHHSTFKSMMNFLMSYGRVTISTPILLLGHSHFTWCAMLSKGMMTLEKYPLLKLASTENLGHHGVRIVLLEMFSICSSSLIK